MADEIIIEPVPATETLASFNFAGTSESEYESKFVDEAVEEKVEEIAAEVTPEAKVEEAKVEAIPEKIKFANEDSENIYNLLVEGKDEEVLSVLLEQKKLKEADKLSPSEILKLNLQYQNKEFSAEEINDLFNDTYDIPEVPEQDITETDEEFEDRQKKYEKDLKKIEGKMARDAKPAIKELQDQLKNIVLPSTKIEPTAKVPTQEELEVLNTANKKFLKEVSEGVQQFNGYNTTFKDEEVEIPVSYSLSKEQKTQVESLLALSNSNAGEFLQKLGWLDENNEINLAKLTQDIPLVLFKDTVLEKIASETGNKRREASIKYIKKIDYSGGANTGQVGRPLAELQSDFATHMFKNS